MTAGEELTARLGGRWRGSYGVVRCPCHDDREPSLSIRDGDRAVLLVCHAGCEPRDIVAALHRDGHRPEATWPMRKKAPPRRSAEDTRRFLNELWRQCGPIAGTLVELYLRGRGIADELPPSLRFHPRLKHAPSGQVLPALVAAVQGPAGPITGLHRTYLRADGMGKADVTPSRMMLGRCSTGAVRLSRAGSELAIGEGLETCLAFQQAMGIASWATLSTSGLRAVILPPLPLAATVYVVVDADTAGEAAARDAARRLARERRTIKIARPVAGNDMNDALREVHRHGG